MSDIIIFDTTLRDGEQSPGATMSMAEKLTIAEMLERLGVDVIEAGFAASSPGDAECIKEVSKHLSNVTICSLARAKKRDIEVAAEALKYAKKPRIHTFISTSKIQIEHQLRVSEEQVLEMIDETVRYAASFFKDIEWSAMDATRTDLDYLVKAVGVAVNAGATTINVPDTVGYTQPDEYKMMIKTLSTKYPNVCFSVHCHNDLGLATANSFAGVLGGARQVECTINGIGERAGNAALEEVVMILKTRPDLFKHKCNVNSTMIWPVSRFVAAVTGFTVQKNKAIVGANAFAHESGIHQDGMLKYRQTYEIINPETVGVHKAQLVLGKHSGRAAIKDKLSEWGVVLDDQDFESFFDKFKELCDRRKNVTEEDILSVLRDQVMVAPKESVRLVSLSTRHESNESKHEASVSLLVNGKEREADGTGNGPLDAIFNAIQKLITVDSAVLENFEVHSLSTGFDAQAEANVTFRYQDKVWVGHARDTDTLLATTKAYLYATNKILARS